MQLIHNSYWDLGCTCSWLIGFGVEDGKPEAWSEKLISPDDDCVIHSPKIGVSNVDRRRLGELQGSSDLDGRRVAGSNGKISANHAYKARD